jgi:allantoicase
VDGSEEEGGRRKRRSVSAATVEAMKLHLLTMAMATCTWEMARVRRNHGGAKDELTQQGRRRDMGDGRWQLGQKWNDMAA